MLEQNSFTKGMNKDISTNLYQKDSYVDALNFSLITEYGLSTGILRNIKGNDLFVSIPDCSNVVSITKVSDGTSTVTILGQTFTVIFTNLNWQSLLVSQISSNPTLNAAGLISSYNTDKVIVYSGLDTSYNLITASITASINNANGSVNVSYLSAVQGAKILGWGTIRDTIFLFTSTEISTNPSNAQSQIWKMTYDRFTYTSSISLLYHGRLNLSLGHPIPNPGGVLGNYETADIQNLYFTDNYNTPKKINVVDTNLMTSTPSSLESIPDVVFGVSSIQQIIYSGNNKIGNYAVSYRLLQNTGGTSNFLPPSNYIPIISANELASLRLYQTDDISTDAAGETKRVPKSIKSKIFNIDTSYDRIEPVILYKSSEGVPVITVLPSQPVPANGTFEFIYSGNETGIDFTLDEFSSQNLVFQTVKTITSKNNIKFDGNVKYSDFDVDFDARAYRFSGANSVVPRIAELTDSQGNIEYTIDGTNPNYIQVPLNADAIQDPEIKQAPYSYDNFLFQADGSTIGGSGLNISYTFETIVPDQNIKNDPYKISLDTNVQPVPKLAPYAVPGYSSAIIDLDQNPNTQYDSLSNNGALDNSTSPYHQYQIKGYQRDEVYRLAIVFFSKKGEASYTHWIADIRIPNIWMPSQDPGKPANNRDEFSYPTSSFLGNNYYGNTLGINFTVDISSIRDQISGYKIVRVKRADEDKTILGQGFLLPSISYNTENYTLQNGDLSYNQNKNPSGAVYSPSICTFVSPEFLFKTSPAYAGTDQIDIIGNLQSTANGAIYDSSVPAVQVPRARYFKNYTTENGGTAKGYTPIPLFNTVELGTDIDLGGSSTYVLNGLNVVNSSNPDDNTGSIPILSYGNKRLAVIANFVGHYGTPTGLSWDNVLNDDDITTASGHAIYLANYRRPNPTQYGGRSYSERSFSEYISTGNYRQVNNSSTIFNETVFGGDIQVSIFDYVNAFKNYFDAPTYADGFIYGYLAPIECTFPIQLESNTNELTFNKGIPYGAYPWSTTPAFGASRIEVAQEFVINFDFFVSNDAFTYITKPEPYLASNKYDVRIHKSQTKINGELTDSWGIFKQDEFIDLNTAQGELNQLMIQGDRLTAFQDTGISVVAVNDRAVVSDQTGAVTSLGQSGVLARYDYISTKIGSRHQFGFTQSNDAIFFFDINTKNIYKLNGNSPVALSIAKGLSSYLNNNLNGLFQTNDNPYLNKGLTCTYDFTYNEAWFTFKDTVFNDVEKATISQIGNTGIVTFDYGRIPVPACITVNSEILVNFIVNNNTITEVFIVTNISGSTVTAVNSETIISSTSDTIVTIGCKALFSFTLAYNDFIDQFTSFYSYTPSVYVNNYKDIFSPSTALNDLWIHDSANSEYGRFYDTLYPSTLKLLINPSPSETKVFDNYQLMCTSTDPNNNDVPYDFFNQIRLYNDTQNTDFQLLPVDGQKTLARRVERNWNISNLTNRVLYTTVPTNIFTDLNPTDKLFAERMRDKYLFIDLIYNNTDNNKLQLNTFTTEFRKSAR